MNLPPYPDFPTIASDTITLRQIEPTDIGDIIEISFYDALQATTLYLAAEMQAKINKDYLNGESIHWGIADNATDKIIGTCGYYRGFENASGELGCVLLPQYYGKGYMTQAMALAIRFGFETMNLERIWAETTIDNAGAIKLLERLNFIKTEIAIDSVTYGLKKP
ncbi:GCN5 family acetyltransferase [Flavobacterium rivuli WB 3.3-2 = DSM 21788]|uniref:GCN5 family acetyltransferase n=1 Tax=Flavobacterium rivuli WB 3.3-2 = DSM 21788 TaxID=1121895 RepID=A0A0A2LXH9_9FLAO|nr:GNAT family N-acetyltransferase [Flavobacterium rivuli]KGO85092.1 GCN5 family acetyltransferase [Flavobacterium rivuli WB 3.3-2 = DSM 21788]